MGAPCLGGAPLSIISYYCMGHGQITCYMYTVKCMYSIIELGVVLDVFMGACDHNMNSMFPPPQSIIFLQ